VLQSSDLTKRHPLPPDHPGGRPGTVSVADLARDALVRFSYLHGRCRGLLLHLVQASVTSVIRRSRACGCRPGGVPDGQTPYWGLCLSVGVVCGRLLTGGSLYDVIHG
jgi:hypothetical protein